MLKNPNYVYGPRDLMLPAHMNFSVFILDKLWAHKENVALINGATDESITYGDIVQQAMNFSVSLSRMGVGKGDVVGMFTENKQEFWGALIGASSTGAVVTMLSPIYPKDELIHVLKISKPKYMICSPFVFKNYEKLLRMLPFLKTIIVFGDDKPNNVLSYNELAIKVPNVDRELFEPVEVEGQTDTLFIIYSSGTTGMPKGVMLTHLNVISSISLSESLDPAKKTLIINPWYHTMGLMGSMSCLITGNTGVFIPKFDVDLFLRIIEKHQIGQMSLAPPVLVIVCKTTTQYDLSSINMIFSGAAPLHKDLVEAVYAKFPNLQAVLQGYGSSESTLAITKYRYEDLMVARRKPGSVGSVIQGATIKVVDLKTREPLGPMQKGEICVKGHNMMKGYVGIGKGDDFDEEGFYKTGDVGYYDEEEFFYIADRLKERINYKGQSVLPAEVEAALLTHEAVKDVGVIGIPHKTDGEVPLAFVVIQPRQTVTEEDLKQFIAKTLPNHMQLRGGVKFVEQIPKTPSGKIVRKDLRKLVEPADSNACSSCVIS